MRLSFIKKMEFKLIQKITFLFLNPTYFTKPLTCKDSLQMFKRNSIKLFFLIYYILSVPFAYSLILRKIKSRQSIVEIYITFTCHIHFSDEIKNKIDYVLSVYFNYITTQQTTKIFVNLCLWFYLIVVHCWMTALIQMNCK
jgi:hypothetical protein